MIKVLFLSSNPESTSTLKLDEEIRSIAEKIRASDHRDALELISLWAVRPDDLLQALNIHKPQIVHFSGHGSSMGEIILMDNNRQAKPVSEAALRMLFITLKDNIHLVMLNACYSQRQAQVIAEVVDCVIGMTNTISDEAAIFFAASFYRAIGFGRSVKEAFEQGKTALLLNGISESQTPCLLTRQGVDASSIFLVGGDDQIKSLAAISSDVIQQIPPRLKNLLNSGCGYIDIPNQWEMLLQHRPNNLQDYVFCELKMQETQATFVIRVFKAMSTGEVAEYLAKLTLPNIARQNYQWNIIFNDNRIPSYHSFTTIGIQSGDTIFLVGNHREPIVMPMKKR